jgi:tetratricopeptide (TPR) repeat protein
MTTHIFLALGMWDDVVKQNEIASGPDRSRWTPGHYTSWLGYGLLQQGRLAEARRHLEDMRANLPRRNTAGTRSYLASMRAHYVISSERWDDPARVWALDVEGVGPVARAMDAFALGYAALRRGERDEARRRLADLARDDAPPPPANPAAAAVQVPRILARQLQAALLAAEGRGGDAVRLLTEAAALEDALPLEFGPPDVVKPSHELLGETLLAVGRPTEAQRAFERALTLAPRRALSLLGLARAATAAGDHVAAQRATAELRAVWHRADADQPGLAELARGAR